MVKTKQFEVETQCGTLSTINRNGLKKIVGIFFSI